MCGTVPESLGLLRQRCWVSSVGRLVQVREQRLAAFLTGIIGKFHCDWLGGTWWFLSIQTFNGLLSLNAPVKSDEAHTSGHAWTPQKSTVNLIRLGPVLWQTNLVNYNYCHRLNGENLINRARKQTHHVTLQLSDWKHWSEIFRWRLISAALMTHMNW